MTLTPPSFEAVLLCEDYRLNIALARIPAGSFAMGTNDAQPRTASLVASELPCHIVKVPEFCLSRYPITQAQWRVVAQMERVLRVLQEDPWIFEGANLPAHGMCWDQAIEFCARLSVHSGRAFRLPSEAEWEYACRAGTYTNYSWGDTIDHDLAAYGGRDPVPVDHFKRCNQFGLFGMHGNFSEWCQDNWHPTYLGAPTDGSAWLDEGNRKSRIVRGGNFDSSARDCRSASRFMLPPQSSSIYAGLRVACDV